MPIDDWKSGDKSRSESWLIASFLLKTMFVCQTVLPVNVQAVSAQEMIENPELQLFDLIFLFLSFESEKMVNFLGKQMWEQLLFGFIST